MHALLFQAKTSKDNDLEWDSYPRGFVNTVFLLGLEYFIHASNALNGICSTLFLLIVLKYTLLNSYPLLKKIAHTI